MVKVLFVCLGNLCRSPTAQGVFERLVDEAGLSNSIFADSAGTHTCRENRLPDPRAQAAATRRGYDLSGQRARRANEYDLEQFDYVVVMDYDNLNYLRGIAPPGTAHKIRLLMEFARTHAFAEIPDPYYGASGGFERVLDFVEEGVRGLLAYIRSRHGL